MSHADEARRKLREWFARCEGQISEQAVCEPLSLAEYRALAAEQPPTPTREQRDLSEWAEQVVRGLERDIVGGASMHSPDAITLICAQSGEIAELNTEIARLTAERDAAVADTKRLDWLDSKLITVTRNSLEYGYNQYETSVFVRSLSGEGKSLGNAKTWRAAIDAAMKDAPK